VGQLEHETKGNGTTDETSIGDEENLLKFDIGFVSQQDQEIE